MRLMHGKPLIAYTLDQAHESGCFDVVAVSSDSDELLKVAQDSGADLVVRRPDALASDEAGKVDAIVHCVATIEERLAKTFTTIVDLDVTSPLRTSADIVAAVAMVESGNAVNVLTASPSRRSPYFNIIELNEEGFASLSKQVTRPLTRRQDAPPSFDMNASIYVWRRDVFMDDPRIFYDRTALYEMPEERSIDIDTELDWRIVEYLTSPEGKA